MKDTSSVRVWQALGLSQLFREKLNERRKETFRSTSPNSLKFPDTQSGRVHFENVLNPALFLKGSYLGSGEMLNS